MRKKVLSFVISVVFMLSSACLAFAQTNGTNWYYGNVSDWAKPELMDSVANGIADNPDLFENCKSNITRKEFATLAVNLYKEIKKEDPAPAEYDTFSDTSDLSVRIAYNLGIIKGMGNGIFAPNNLVTREQMAVMMLNAVNVLGTDYHKGDGTLVMTDKNQVSSWAKNGVDFVYENDFMKGDGFTFNPKSNTSIEQAVAIVNRVYKKYANQPIREVEPNDYRKGYHILLESDGVYAQYNNTGNIELVLKYGESFKTTNEDRMALVKVKKAVPSSDYRNVYFLSDDGIMCSYDFAHDCYFSYVSSFGLINNFALVERGKYKGYYLVSSYDESGVIAYDSEFYRVGQVYTLDPYTVENYIDAAYINQQEPEEYGEDDEFAMGFYLDNKRYDNLAQYGGNCTKDTTLRMVYNNESTGPICLIANWYNNPIVYRSSGAYTATMNFKNEEQSNAGIVFNVTRASVGNDQYTGYYAGIDPKDNNVQLGWCDYKWHRIKQVKLPFDVQPGYEYELRVEKIGKNICVYVDGVEYINVEDSMLNVDGYTGLRGWKADVEYTSFSAERIPV